MCTTSASFSPATCKISRSSDSTQSLPPLTSTRSKCLVINVRLGTVSLRRMLPVRNEPFFTSFMSLERPWQTRHTSKRIRNVFLLKFTTHSSVLKRLSLLKVKWSTSQSSWGVHSYHTQFTFVYSYDHPFFSQISEPLITCCRSNSVQGIKNTHKKIWIRWKSSNSNYSKISHGQTRIK